MPRLTVHPDGLAVEGESGETILAASLRAGVPHIHACGGRARCSTCRVLVLGGRDGLAPRNEAEAAIAERLALPDGIRLACQTPLASDTVVRRIALDHDDEEWIVAELDEARNSKPVAAGCEERAAILFADLRGFTSFAESLPPYDVISVLNRFFYRMGRAIGRNGGRINAYMGDGLMALFEEDAAHATHCCLRACAAAVEMQAGLEKLNPNLESLYGRALKMGIGIHYGEVVVGAVGEARDKRITAIGDAVNLASRIETKTKETGAAILVSEAVRIQSPDRIRAARSFSLEIPGKTGLYTLHELEDVR